MSHSKKQTENQNVAVVGLQWGDEGKGKIVDVLTEHADVVVRYCGGANAGLCLAKADSIDATRIRRSAWRS